MRYLAIDYGIKRTGLAICDPAETIASPLMVIDGQKDIVDKITKVIKDENVEEIVIGLPINMDDSQGPQAKLVLRFADKLRKNLNIPVHFQDERLSTFGAEEKLRNAELPKKKKAERLDAVAAAEILAAFLEEKKT
jgi:putative Holliday junction resolvase